MSGACQGDGSLVTREEVPGHVRGKCQSVRECQRDGSLVTCLWYQGVRRTVPLSYSCHIHCSMLLWQECYKKNYIVRDNVGMS